VVSAKSSESSLTCVAYFSMEFMLSEAIPIYSGGLGNVAAITQSRQRSGRAGGGVGLLYQQGYFRQEIDRDGAQQALTRTTILGNCRSPPLRQPNGEWLRLEIALPGGSIWLRAWQVQVGRVNLYLLDSNDAANSPIHRGITSELYGGGPELRLKQEMVLGIGGWRLLLALAPAGVCHLNEGHAAFAVLERARSCMEETALPFEVALAVTRAGTSSLPHGRGRRLRPLRSGPHRAIPGGYAERLGVTLPICWPGRRDPGDSSESFNMAYLAIRGSGAVNAVSLLHGEVSRRLFGLFSALAGSRGAHWARDQRGAHATWTRHRPMICGQRPAARTLDGDDGNLGEGHSWRLRRQALAI